MTEEQYLTSIIPTRAEVDAFVERVVPNRPSRNGGVTYDPQLGWIRIEAVRPEGVDGSKAFYSYEPDHARKVCHHAERPSRVHTYGDSFTHCDQVSDGETWQEFLAAHLQEPIRNYGVGGYSVYQAYLRMKHLDTTRRAPYIILNIYDHDHFRNLFDWWAINFGQRVECGFTCPHVRVNVEKNLVEEIPNRLRAPEDVYQLCDRDWVIETFRGDPVLPVALARRHPEMATTTTVRRVADGFGLSMKHVANLTPLDAIQKLAGEAAMFATQGVVKLVDAFARATDKKLMILLSHCMPYTADALAGKQLWDQSFVDFLKARGIFFFDMRDAFAKEFATSSAAPMAFLEKYYNGHHSPAGNFFTAWAIKDTVAKWLHPRPLPYDPRGDDVTDGTMVQQAKQKPSNDVRAAVATGGGRT